MEADAGSGHDGSAATGDAGHDSGVFVSDAACTPIHGNTFACYKDECNGATSYCLETGEAIGCMPLPSQCQCVETMDCACLQANVPKPCDAGPANCEILDDGGLLWLIDPYCL
jgi:hypothetical protein